MAAVDKPMDIATVVETLHAGQYNAAEEVSYTILPHPTNPALSAYASATPQPVLRHARYWRVVCCRCTRCARTCGGLTLGWVVGRWCGTCVRSGTTRAASTATTTPAPSTPGLTPGLAALLCRLPARLKEAQRVG
eukprot:3257466-Rhodomonas_salina.2